MEQNCEKCLADIFSAQKIKDAGAMEDIALLEKELAYVTDFLILLRNEPPFWGRTYRKRISELCENMGL